MIQDSIQKTIDKHRLFRRSDEVTVGVSGGADSVCLLHALREMGYRVQIAHVNHMLRDDADDDEEYVRGLGVPCIVKRVDVGEYAAKNRISPETAGREVRYAFFKEIGGIVATGHHLNDSVESLIMHLMRGSGMTGLVGIRPKIGNIVRPLIECEREDIEAYCRQHDLQPRQDYTNDDTNFTRNDVRHNILPLFKDRGALQAIARCANILSCEDDYLRKQCTAHSTQYMNVKDFNIFHLAIKRRILKDKLGDNAGLLHIDAIIEMVEKNYGGKQIEIGDKVARIYKGELLIEDFNRSEQD